jgi:hypothetical protein
VSRIDALGVGGPTFPANSRYAGVGIRTLASPEGATVTYLTRRFLPPPTAYSSYGEHRTTDYDRLDLIAAALVGDPLLAWRLQDANGAMDPGELTRDVGRVLVVPLPQGVAVTPRPEDLG